MLTFKATYYETENISFVENHVILKTVYKYEFLWKSWYFDYIIFHILNSSLLDIYLKVHYDFRCVMEMTKC